ncbi:hypothetical protein ALI144C_05565 [Actinosynnema sp. ALI-1.44]|uniref:sunset domain-containing protein n=1 Tax=Actinosynnema sp. ALI-1.44 TaxID=1933779 RepID=UPI00097BFE07|nr:hypothetical protein ALI144C_05565 [Actinosynnema sp. ALI-1.44]
MWLAGQVYLLCLVSFLAGAGITFLALRGRLAAPAPTAGAEAVGEPDDDADDDIDGDAPEPVVVRASKKSMRYHTPDSPHYGSVRGGLEFISVADAELAGFRAWDAEEAPRTDSPKVTGPVA